jgi:hypothetical protein
VTSNDVIPFRDPTVPKQDVGALTVEIVQREEETLHDVVMFQNPPHLKIIRRANSGPQKFHPQRTMLVSFTGKDIKLGREMRCNPRLTVDEETKAVMKKETEFRRTGFSEYRGTSDFNVIQISTKGDPWVTGLNEQEVGMYAESEQDGPKGAALPHSL